MLHLLRKKSKGYILLETLVVVGILSVILVGMYSSFLNLYSVFKSSKTYDNTEYLYRTRVLREQLNIDASLGSDNIVTICNNADSSNSCDSHSEYANVFKKLEVQYAFLARATITIGDVYTLSNVPVTIKRYIRDLDIKADDTDVILIVAYKSNNPGYEVASINYSKTEKVAKSTFDSVTSGLDSTTIEIITKPEGNNCTNTFAYDGTTQNNLRFVGPNPCNYVTFNGETAGWRILGVMNEVDNGSGKLEKRIKIVKKNSLGTYIMDSNNHNNFPNTALNQTLQDYFETLDTTSKGMVGPALWHLGALLYADYNSDENGNAAKVYEAERDTNVWGSTSGQNCNDGQCPRATSIISKIGLPYASDVGFSVGGTDEKRATCLSSALSHYSSNSCYSNSWALKATWVFPPENTSNRGFAFNASKLDFFKVDYSRDVRPSVYLQPWVKITGGSGSQSDPYTLGI